MEPDTEPRMEPDTEPAMESGMDPGNGSPTLTGAPPLPPAPVCGGGEIALDPNLFGAPVNPALHYDAVRQYLAGLRAGTHATRTRALVAGGGRKPWRQKGTGNARSGSRRNPLWRGGGTVFGPQPRDYGYRLPGRMQRGAVRSALSLRASEGAVRVYEEIELDRPSTKQLLGRLNEWGVPGGRVLLVEESPGANLVLSARNVPGLEVLSVAALHCYHLLKARTLLVRRSALPSLEQKLDHEPGHGPEPAPVQVEGVETEGAETAGAAPPAAEPPAEPKNAEPKKVGSGGDA